MNGQQADVSIMNPHYDFLIWTNASTLFTDDEHCPLNNVIFFKDIQQMLSIHL
jgi:hypothetical protein